MNPDNWNGPSVGKRIEQFVSGVGAFAVYQAKAMWSWVEAGAFGAVSGVPQVVQKAIGGIKAAEGLTSLLELINRGNIDRVLENKIIAPCAVDPSAVMLFSDSASIPITKPASAKCSDGEYAKFRAKIHGPNGECDKVFDCEGVMDPTELQRRADQAQRCLDARLKITNKCFGGVFNESHKQEYENIQRAQAKCLSRIYRKT